MRRKKICAVAPLGSRPRVSQRRRDTLGDGRSSERLLCLRVAHKPPVRRERVHEARKCLAQAPEQVVVLHAGLAGQRSECVGPARALAGATLDRLVWSAADPGVDGIALTALLQLLEQIAEAPVQSGTGRGACEDASEGASE